MDEVRNDSDVESGQYRDSDTDLPGVPGGNEPIDPNMAAFHAYLFTGAVALAKTSGSYASREILEQEIRDTNQAKEREAKSDAFQIAMDVILQRQIDSNILSLKIDGKDIDISQKDLRELMEERVRDLKERREEMIKNGASPDEIAAIDQLIGRYEPLVDDLKKGKADSDTLDDIQGLIEDDPGLADDIKDFKNKQSEASIEMKHSSRSTSFTAEYFDECDKPSIRADFNTPASGGAEPSEPDSHETPTITKIADNTFDSFGI